MPKCSQDFYLRPLVVPNGDVWYSCQPRGRHALEKVIKKLCKQSGLDGKHTNHSCRASSATRMYDQGLDVQLICEKTGHRSVAVRSYKRTSNKQLKQVTDVLYGNKTSEINEGEVKPKITKVESEPSATVSKAPPEVTTSDGNDDKKSEEEIKPIANVEVAKGITLNININVSK